MRERLGDGDRDERESLPRLLRVGAEDSGLRLGAEGLEPRLGVDERESRLGADGFGLLLGGEDWTRGVGRAGTEERLPEGLRLGADCRLGAEPRSMPPARDGADARSRLLLERTVRSRGIGTEEPRPLPGRLDRALLEGLGARAPCLDEDRSASRERGVVATRDDEDEPSLRDWLKRPARSDDERTGPPARLLRWADSERCGASPLALRLLGPLSAALSERCTVVREPRSPRLAAADSLRLLPLVPLERSERLTAAP